MYTTPAADKVLKIYQFKTKEGILFNDTITQGGKEIMECILTRQAPDSSMRKRVQVEAHTRYGKSLAIAAGLSVRSSAFGEPWAAVAGTQDKAQIIMDYTIDFIVGDPILSSSIIFDKGETLQLLRQHRARNRITFKQGGEIRAFGAGKNSGGEAIMGFGASSVIEDECYLIDDNTHSKVMRMLGDQTDNFLMKVGNPWERNHAYRSRIDPNYFKLVIDYHQGLKEGRLTPEYVEEMRKQPNFSVLYECIPPEEDAMDNKGWLPLITEKTLREAFVQENEVDAWGMKRLGNDVADQGADASASVLRQENLARITFEMHNTGPLGMANHIALQYRDLHPQVIYVDRVGVGAGTLQRLLLATGGIETITQGVNTGERAPTPDFANMKAYLYWELKKWLEAGGKLIYDERWLQLLTIRYKSTESKVEIMSKKEMRARGIPSPDIAEAFCLTFYPTKNYHVPPGTPMRGGSNNGPMEDPFTEVGNDNYQAGGAEPLYPEWGI